MTPNYYTTTLNDFNNDRLYDYNCVYKYELGNNKVYMVDDYRNGNFNVNIQNNDLQHEVSQLTDSSTWIVLDRTIDPLVGSVTFDMVLDISC